jgi:iron complex outermembrane receptor protein
MEIVQGHGRLLSYSSPHCFRCLFWLEPVTLPEITVTGAAAKDTGYKATRATTATKTDTPLIEAPQSISVITRDRLEAQNVQSLAEALRYTPGVQGEPFGFDPRFPSLQIRGFQAFRGLYRDGLQVNQFGIPQFRVELYGVERIEVLRGPASVLYGQNNPGGIVNFVSKRPTALPFREVELQMGSFNLFQGAFDLSGPVTKDGTLLFRLTGLARDSDTQVEFVEDDRLFIAPTLTWRPRAGTTLTILGHYQSDSTDFTSSLPAEGTVLSNRFGRIPVSRYSGEPGFAGYDRTQSAIGYLFEHQAGDAWTFRQNARYDYLDVGQQGLFGTGLQADQRTLNRLSFDSESDKHAFAIDTQAQARFVTGPLAHTLLGGLDYQRLTESVFGGCCPAGPPIDVFDPVYGQAVPRPPINLDTDTTLEQIGLYLQDQIKLYERLVLVLGGRHDWASSDTDDRISGTSTEQEDRAFTARAGLVYLFDVGVAPYVSYSESFLPIVGTNLFGEPFEPERGQQYEIGVKYQPPGTKSFVTVAAFDLRRQNVLTADPTNPFNRVQTEEVRSRGVELEGIASLPFGLDVVASYTYLDTEITKSNAGDEGKRPLIVPEHLASLWADYTIRGTSCAGLGFGGGVRYIGSTFGDTANTLEVPDYTLADAAVHYEWRGLRFAVNAKNLFDKEHVASCFGPTFCRYGDGRTVIGTVGYRW